MERTHTSSPNDIAPAGFSALAEDAGPSAGPSVGFTYGGEPQVLRGAAADWPAIQRWTFPYLASIAPDLAVQLVVGDRENGQTRFESSTLGAYLASLEHPEPGRNPGYLKEFNLLARLPGLRNDLRQKALFPSGSISSSSAWIGPAGAKTGLHHDLLDNVAVQVVGRKRFYLARPGTVERAGQLSTRYDRWARLSQIGAIELAEGRATATATATEPGRAATHETRNDHFVVDLEPGDILNVPATWWHEVENLTPSVLLSGFFGPRLGVSSLWATESSRHLAHTLGWVGRHGCTCHAESATSSHRSRPVAGR